jgi:hypothetical protein
VPVRVGDEIEVARDTYGGALRVLDDVDQVFEISWLTGQPIGVVEDDTVDPPRQEVADHAPELGTDDDPVG